MILITGATGNNGQELTRQLTAMGHRVRVLIRKPAEAAKLDGSNIEVAAGDFDQPETLEAALQGVEKAFLLTPVAERFVQWQKDFIVAARRAKIKHLVKFSGMGADSHSPSELLKLHAETDDILRSSGVPSRFCSQIRFIKMCCHSPTRSRRRACSISLLRTRRKAQWISATSARSQLRYSRIPVTKGRPMSSPGRKP